jgi:hypothetical protein
MGEQAANTKQPAEPKERTHGNAQKNSYTLLLVLPPTEFQNLHWAIEKELRSLLDAQRNCEPEVFS